MAKAQSSGQVKRFNPYACVFREVALFHSYGQGKAMWGASRKDHESMDELELVRRRLNGIDCSNIA